MKILNPNQNKERIQLAFEYNNSSFKDLDRMAEKVKCFNRKYQTILDIIWHKTIDNTWFIELKEKF